MKGKYVLFEGPDGSGKTTLTKMLVKALEAAHERVRHLGFPGRDSAIGRFIRDDVFAGRVTINPEAMMWLFIAERKDMDPQIRRHITEGDWIVSDRDTQVSGLIYQGEVHGQTRVDAVTQPANFVAPDRIYLIDVPAQVAMERRGTRGEARNVLYEPEQVDRLDSMCKAYRALRERFAQSVIVDGTKPLAENLQWIWQDLGLSGEPLVS